MRVLLGMESIEIGGAADSAAAAIENVRVDHRRPNIAVAKQFE